MAGLKIVGPDRRYVVPVHRLRYGKGGASVPRTPVSVTDEQLEQAASDVIGLQDTCSLDVADRGGLTLEEIAPRLGVTRERVRQYEQIAFRRLRAVFARSGVSHDDLSHALATRGDAQSIGQQWTDGDEGSAL